MKKKLTLLAFTIAATASANYANQESYQSNPSSQSKPNSSNYYYSQPSQSVTSTQSVPTYYSSSTASSNVTDENPQDLAATPEDKQLNAKIRERLKGGILSKGFETLILRTSNGMVVISGTVEKEEDVKNIEDQVKKIEGVRSVSNQLTPKQ